MSPRTREGPEARIIDFDDVGSTPAAVKRRL
jgi:hypothetical protein